MIRVCLLVSPTIYPFRPICIPWYVTESERKRRGEVAYLSEPPSLFYRMRHIDPIERQKLQSCILGRAKEQERSRSIHSVFSATKTQVVQCLFTEQQQPAADDIQHSRSRRTETIIIISRQLHQVESLKNMLFNLGSMYESSVVIRRCVDEHLSSGSGIR